jgi:soluble lytic murein transglycosylase-like protein
MKLPAYTANGTLDTGGAFRLQSPDTQVASAVANFGGEMQDLGTTVGKVELARRAKLKEDGERAENLRLERDLLDVETKWRDDLEAEKTNATEDGEGFTDGFTKRTQPDVDALEAKYPNHHLGPDYVKLKVAQSRKGYENAASVFEFQKSAEFKKKTFDDKIANLSAAASVDGASYEQVELEYRHFVDTTLSGNPKVRQQGYEYGLRQIQTAYIAGKAARDKKGYLETFYKTFGAKADDSTGTASHIASTITSAEAQGVDPNLILGIGYIESTLNPAQGNPIGKDGKAMSSADGMFQITKPMAETLGLSPADVKDPAKASAALSAFVSNKQEWMRANRIEPTPGRTFMFWNMGAGAATAVLRANPNERIENVLARVHASKGPEYIQRVLYNNPKMYKPGMTVGEVQKNYETQLKTAMSATRDMASGAGIAVDDRASSLVTEFLGVAPEGQFVQAADLAKIAQDVTADYGKETKDTLDYRRGQAFLSENPPPIDPYSSDDKRAVEKALVDQLPALTEGVTKGDGAALSTVRSMADQIRHVPEPVRNAMRATLETGSPQAKASVYGTLLDLRKADTTAFNATNFDADTQKRIEEFEAYTTELQLPPAKAIAIIDGERTEEGKKRAETLKGDVNSELGKISDRKVVGTFSADTVGITDIDENRLTPLIRSHFDLVYRNAREDGKDKEQAEALATSSIKSSFGVSEVASSGSGSVVMLYPPETQYPAMSNGHDWITDQAKDNVGVYLLRTGRVKTETTENVATRIPSSTKPAWQAAEDRSRDLEVRLISSADTQDDIRHGRKPRYQLWFRNEQGQVEKATDAFVPDETQARHVDRALFKSREEAERGQPFDNRGASVIRATEVQRGNDFTPLQDLKQTFKDVGRAAVPVNIRTFVSHLAGDRGKITERLFAKSDLDALRAAVRTNMSKGNADKGVIGYGEYGGNGTDEFSSWGRSPGVITSIADSYTDPKFRMETTVGMATWRKDDKGNIIVEDRYNFNAPGRAFVDKKKKENGGTLGALVYGYKAAGIVGVLNALGNIVGDTEGEPGNKVQINLGKI